MGSCWEAIQVKLDLKKIGLSQAKKLKKKKSKLGPDNSMIERRMKSLGVSGKPPDLE